MVLRRGNAPAKPTAQVVSSTRSPGDSRTHPGPGTQSCIGKTRRRSVIAPAVLQDTH